MAGPGAVRGVGLALSAASVASSSRRVAVIGAGASGLAAAKNLQAKKIQPVVFEQRKSPAGVWNRDPNRPPNENPVYDSLKTNLPRQLMQFWDLPWDDNLPSYVTHQHVLQYLNRYCDFHKLAHSIRFGHRVQKLDRFGDGWRIFFTVGDSGRLQDEVFDAVVIANGHFASPSIPEIEGREEFEATGRTVTHSSSYRDPRAYHGLTILVVGGGPSGSDLALDLRSGGANVIMSYRGGVAAAPVIGDHVHLVPGLKSLTSQGTALFDDGSQSSPIDAVILATGYRYDVPFLDEETLTEEASSALPATANLAPIRIVNGRATGTETYIAPLYEQIFWAADETLSFVGLQWKIVPFPLADAQASLIAAVLSGEVSLPSCETMLATATDELIAMRRHGAMDLHMLAANQWSYVQRVLDMAGEASPYPRSMYEPRLRIMQRINEDSAARRKACPRTYRDAEYTIAYDSEHPGGGWFCASHPTHPTDERNIT